MEPTADQPPRKRRKGLIILLILLGVLAAPWVLFWAAGEWVNSRSIPEELAEPPAEIAAKVSAREQGQPASATQEGNDAPKPGDETDTGTLRAIEKLRIELTGSSVFEPNRRGYRPPAALVKEIEERFPPRPGTLENEEFLTWVNGQADLFGLIYQYANSKDFTLSEVHFTMLRLLRGHGYACVRQADGEGALADARAILQLLRRSHAAYGPWDGMTTTASTYFAQLIRYWLKQTACPWEPMAGLLPDLEKASRRLFSKKKWVDGWREYYCDERARVVGILNAPWSTPQFGWKRGSGDYSLIVYPPFGEKRESILLPRLNRVIPDALRSMEHKRRAPDFLRQYDAQWKAALEAWALDYPQYKAQGCGPEWPKDKFPFTYQVNVPEAGWGLDVFLFQETSVGLWRAAITLLQDPAALGRAKEVDFRANPGHPLRDPFAEQCLHVDAGTTQTRIWSLGPDLTDEGGDPQTDIVLEFPRAIGKAAAKK